MIFTNTLTPALKLEKLLAAIDREAEAIEALTAKLADLREAYADDCADAAEAGELMPGAPKELCKLESESTARIATHATLRSRLPEVEALAAAEKQSDLERRRREVVAPIAKRYAEARAKFEAALETFLGIGGREAYGHARLALNYSTPLYSEFPASALLAKAELDDGKGSTLNDHITMPSLEDMFVQGKARAERADTAIKALIAKN